MRLIDCGKRKSRGEKGMDPDSVRSEVTQSDDASLDAEDIGANYFLQSAFNYGVEKVRDAAAEALTALSHPEFKQALDDVAAFVQARDSGSLETGAPPCASLFIQALGNSESHVRACAEAVLVKIGTPAVSDLL